MKMIREFLRDEDGQTTIEYILLLAVVAAIIFKFKDTATAQLDALTKGVFSKADSILQAP